MIRADELNNGGNDEKSYNEEYDNSEFVEEERK
jgi:hypothetical protein